MPVYCMERRLQANEGAEPSFADFYAEPAPAQPAWQTIAFLYNLPNPAAWGIIGAKYGDEVRVTKDGVLVSRYEWVRRVPVNPGDLECTDFMPGWKVVEHHSSIPLSSDELAHFYNS